MGNRGRQYQEPPAACFIVYDTTRIHATLHANTVLIIDEMHLLCHTLHRSKFLACVEFIRRIGDNTGAGLVLCGTKLFDSSLEARIELEQISKRGVHSYPLPDTLYAADVRLIVEASGLPWAQSGEPVTVEGRTEKPYALLKSLAHNDGLTTITERIRYARKFATRAKQPLSLAHFVEAHLLINNSKTLEPTGWK